MTKNVGHFAPRMAPKMGPLTGKNKMRKIRTKKVSPLWGLLVNTGAKKIGTEQISDPDASEMPRRRGAAAFRKRGEGGTFFFCLLVCGIPNASNKKNASRESLVPPRGIPVYDYLCQHNSNRSALMTPNPKKYWVKKIRK